MSNDAGARHGRDVDPADPASVARSRDRAISLLRDALSKLNRQGFSPSHPVGEVVQDEFSLLASAVRSAGGEGYEIMVSANCHPEPLDALDGLTLDLHIGADLHFLAAMDETGSTSFSGIEAGEWQLRPLARAGKSGTGSGFAMPRLARPGALAAAEQVSGAEDFTRRVHAPDGTVFTVVTPPGADATLEISFSATADGETPFLVPVTYQTRNEQEAVLLAAVVRHRGRVFTALALTDFDPYGEWSVADRVDPAALSRWPAAVITESVLAARAYPQASHFWRRVAELAPPSATDAIRSTLG